MVIGDWRRSQGTLGEMSHAALLGIPVLFGTQELAAWLERSWGQYVSRPGWAIVTEQTEAKQRAINDKQTVRT